MNPTNQARVWLYNTIMQRLQQESGTEYTVVLPHKECPRTVTKLLADGSRLEVELSWARDAPQVVWAARIFTLDGEDLLFPLPLDLIRLAVARDPPRRDSEPAE